MKTIGKALRDDIHYPIPFGKVENVCIEREIPIDGEYTKAVRDSYGYKGALADCLFSLLTAVSFSEGGMSVGSLTNEQRKLILRQANDLYGEIGEKLKDDPLAPKVYINC